MATYGDLTAPRSVVKGSSESDINSLNAWMRSQPWYQEQLAKWGVNPSSVKLSDAQRQQLVSLAQQNGVQVDQGNIEVDPAGNFNPIGHKLRNTLIGAGVAGAAIGAPYLLGALGGGGAAAAPALASGVPEAIGGASALSGGAAALGAAPALAVGGGGAAMAAPALTAAGGGASGSGGGFGHFVSSLFGGPSGLVSAGLGAAGMLLNNKASGDATAAQLKAQQEALKAQIDMYNQQTRVKAETYNNTQANLAPYQGLGKGAASLAGYGLGIPGYETGNTSVVYRSLASRLTLARFSIPVRVGLRLRVPRCLARLRRWCP